MAVYELSKTAITPLELTTFAANAILERRDLQRLLRDSVEVIAPGTLVVAEEFGEWADSGRRIDLLGLDRAANLVVIELKRTEDGGHMDLQAIRYAAMLSAMTFGRLVEVYAEYLRGLDRNHEEAEKLILDFLNWEAPEEDNFAADVRIVLAASNFSKEVTTTVMWLNERDVDIRCVRLQPYRLEDRVLLDVQQIIPLPEAGAYQVQLRAKATERRQSRRSENGPDFTRYDLSCGKNTHPRQWKRNMVLAVVRAAVDAGISPVDLPVPRGKWRIVTGTCASQAEFEASLKTDPDAGTRVYTVGRWFSSDHELLHFDGKTYCLSNQWGADALELIDQIAKRYPQLEITYTASETLD